MTLSRRTLLATLAAAPFATLASRSAFAAYPDRPIRLIVPFAPGGNADLVGRLLAETMAPSLGQSLVVENRAGAGGSLGAGVVAQSAPDGYTLLIGSNGPLTVNPFMQSKLSYDPLKDFTAVGLANLAPHAIVVNPGVPAKTVAELVALSKTRTINIATSGTGSAGT
jgi:tripartite-type tricarboxylate transporter receptor subunit TctC